MEDPDPIIGFVKATFAAITALSGAIIYLFHQIVKLSKEVGKFEGKEKATNDMCEKTLETVDRAIREKNKQ